MKPKDMLQLAVRLLGLVFLYHGLRAVPPAIGQVFGSFPRELAPGVRTNQDVGAFFGGFIMVIWPLLVAYWLLRGAPLIMRLAYPEAPASSEPEVAQKTGGPSDEGVNYRF